MTRALGCIIPKDKSHVTAKPLRGLDKPPVDVPAVVGVNWYDSFDNPKEMASTAEGISYHLPDVEKGESLGSVRGGHCFCLEPMGAVKVNRESLRVFYNQGEEGACVGFGHARAQSIMRGYKLFDAFWLYDEARRLEGNTGEGSTCRSAVQVLETLGLREQNGNEVCLRDTGDGPVNPKLGIKTARWATTADEVMAALARPNAQAVPFTNNWGDGYPLTCWLPVATLQRLLDESGECDVETEL
jgi:hypothetical protein